MSRLMSPSSLTIPPPKLSPEQLQQPTSILYSASASSSSNKELPQLYGPYLDARTKLDYTYHKVPSKERQSLQDEIVTNVLHRTVKECQSGGDEKDGKMRKGQFTREELGEKPLALFTAGGMGAGKGHVLREMLRKGTIQLPPNFVWVDPDNLARELPEREQYLRSDPTTASSLLHPEASMLQEILSNVAMSQRRSLVVDGSLSDCGWFSHIMKQYQKDGYDCEILFVTAPEEKMLERAKRRAKITGRVTNPEAIKRSRVKSPECVSHLSTPGHVARVRLIDNASDEEPPQIIYDSKKDPSWTIENEHATVDVKGFVEGRLYQAEDGRVREKPKLNGETNGNGSSVEHSKKAAM